jgi:hypothetical protein
VCKFVSQLRETIAVFKKALLKAVFVVRRGEYQERREGNAKRRCTICNFSACTEPVNMIKLRKM